MALCQPKATLATGSDTNNLFHASFERCFASQALPSTYGTTIAFERSNAD